MSIRVSLIFLISIVLIAAIKSQPETDVKKLDSLLVLYRQYPSEDTGKIDLMALISLAYKACMRPTEGIRVLSDAILLQNRLENKSREKGLYAMISFALYEIGESEQSIAYLQKQLQFKDLSNSEKWTALNFLGLNYKTQGDLAKAMYYLKESTKYIEPDDPFIFFMSPFGFGVMYTEYDKQDSAIYFSRQAWQRVQQAPLALQNIFSNQILNQLIQTYIKFGMRDSAYHYLFNYHHPSTTYFGFSNINDKINKDLNYSRWHAVWGSKDSTYRYALLAYTLAESMKNYFYMIEASSILLHSFEKYNDYKNALVYSHKLAAAKDSLQGVSKVSASQFLHYHLLLNEQNAANEKNKIKLKNQLKLLGLSTLFLGFLGTVFYQNSQARKKTIIQLNNQNQTIEYQKSELSSSLVHLKNTQAQLIYSEKMASLGELTAGIAHEIQNPLNFVNNFSELNTELLNDLKALWNNKESNENDILDLFSDIQDNSEKINHHGKRASLIVKSMLDHTNSTSGQKILTKINGLIDEYIRLSYHAYQVKINDNNFHVNIITELDESDPEIYVSAGEMGRVLLNMINNSFQSLHEKLLKCTTDYNPILKICSHVQPVEDMNYLTITIYDNGLGIKNEIKSKVFQPFFTTKPTGQGTGLGLSLSYDIITKLHKGKIEINTIENEFCEMKIYLPL